MIPLDPKDIIMTPLSSPSSENEEQAKAAVSRRLEQQEDVEEGRPQGRRVLRMLTRELSIEKHVLRIKDVFEKIDSQKRIYPNGLISKVEEDGDANSGQVERIELFSENRRSKQVHGILRSLFLGFSNEKELLDLADYSNRVISIRTISRDFSEGGKVVQDNLVLKRREDKPGRNPGGELNSVFPSSDELLIRRNKLPSLYVSSRWLDRMDLCSGDRILVSNPVENYATPPPDYAKTTGRSD